jgi:hypothetical protein
MVQVIIIIIIIIINNRLRLRTLILQSFQISAEMSCWCWQQKFKMPHNTMS